MYRDRDEVTQKEIEGREGREGRKKRVNFSSEPSRKTETEEHTQ